MVYMYSCYHEIPVNLNSFTSSISHSGAVLMDGSIYFKQDSTNNS